MQYNLTNTKILHYFVAIRTHKVPKVVCVTVTTTEHDDMAQSSSSEVILTQQTEGCVPFETGPRRFCSYSEPLKISVCQNRSRGVEAFVCF